MKVCPPRLSGEAPCVSKSQSTSFCDMADRNSLHCISMLAILTKPDTFLFGPAWAG